MAIYAENYDPALKAGAVINTSDDIALENGKIIVGSSSGVGAAVTPSGDIAMTNAGVVTVTDLTIASEARGDILRRGASAWQRLSAKDSGKILVGDGTDVVSVSVSGDATLAASGALTIAASAVTASKVADTAGTPTLFVRKSALVTWDFAVDGGNIGTITPTGSPTIPDNAVVWIESYDVLQTLTSEGADAGEFKIVLPTDGDLNTSIAISAGGNPWDLGVYSFNDWVLTTTTKKTTAARVPQVVIGAQNITAGKVVFQLAYWVSA